MFYIYNVTFTSINLDVCLNTGLFTSLIKILTNRVKEACDASVTSTQIYPRCFDVLIGGCFCEDTDSDKFMAPSYLVCYIFRKQFRRQ